MKAQHLVAGSLLVGLVVGCGKKKDDDDTPAAPADTQTVAAGAGGDTTTNTTASSTVNALLSAYPSGLALSVFPTEVAAALRLMGTDDAAEEQLTEDSKPLGEKKKEGEDLINGKGASCLSPALKSVREVLDSEETCYQFDEDMLYTGSAPHADDSDRPSADADLKWGGTVDGLSSLTGEACLVSFARSKISQVTSLVDVATGMVQTMMCQAKKVDAAVALPALGGTLDLKAALVAAMGSSGSTTSTSAPSTTPRSSWRCQMAAPAPCASSTRRTTRRASTTARSTTSSRRPTTRPTICRGRTKTAR
jgi:hypothetical protein